MCSQISGEELQSVHSVGTEGADAGVAEVNTVGLNSITVKGFKLTKQDGAAFGWPGCD